MDKTSSVAPRLAGTVALVTGGSRGIGAGIVKRLAREKADVAFTYLKERKAADAVAQEAGSDRRRVLAMQVAAMVAFLVSPEAKFATGAAFVIDNGFTA